MVDDHITWHSNESKQFSHKNMTHDPMDGELIAENKERVKYICAQQSFGTYVSVYTLFDRPNCYVLYVCIFLCVRVCVCILSKNKNVARTFIALWNDFFSCTKCRRIKKTTNCKLNLHIIGIRRFKKWCNR